jgi:predicted transposase/invertase (TIGR01784 family)
LIDLNGFTLINSLDKDSRVKKHDSSTQHVTHAHDKFFKMAMSDKRVAREFFETHLPEELRHIVELDKLELEPSSYIDDMRQEAIADILFKTQISGHIAYLYLIVDHQSRPDVLMPFRILKYTCNIIDKHLKETKSKRIPLILPLVVYHGKTQWLYSTHINDLVDAPKELVEAYLLKPFFLVDLNVIEDAVLKERAWVGIMELTLKHIFARDIQPYLADITALMKMLGAEGKTFTETVLIYILDKAEIKDKEAFFNLIKAELSEETGEKIMTIAEQLRIEGMQKGIEKGIEKGRQEIIGKLLQAGMSIAEIAKLLNLPIDEVKQLAQ